MTTSHPHINTRGGSRFARLLPFVLAASGAAALLPSTALASYGWPVKPFDQPHPVRGLFGDPRTLFSQSPTRAGLFFGGGLFSFHFGVDVSAPDGTPVYAVESGVVDTVSKSYVGVTCEGVAFQYWHLTASVHVGQRIEARSTVLGRILHGAGHVHLTEIDHGRVVDPLLPGHLAPYRDRTTPWVSSIHLRRTDDGPDVVPGFVQGRVELLAEAYDTPNLPVPGEWHGLPVTPALVTWRIEQWNGKVVVPEPSPATCGQRSRRARPSGRSTRAARTRTCPCSESTSRGSSPAATSSGSPPARSTPAG